MSNEISNIRNSPNIPHINQVSYMQNSTSQDKFENTCHNVSEYTRKQRKQIEKNHTPYFIPTIDISNKKPILVRQGVQYKTTIDFKQALLCLSINSIIHIADIDRAKNENSNKDYILDVIRELKEENTRIGFYIGGGIRTKEDAMEFLQFGAERVVIGTNIELLFLLPKERLVFSLDINDNFIVMINGRKNKMKTSDIYIKEIKKYLISNNDYNTDINENETKDIPNNYYLDYPVEINFKNEISQNDANNNILDNSNDDLINIFQLLFLVKNQIEMICITFHDSEGREKGVNKEKLSIILNFFAKYNLKIKVIYAGGISNINDIKYLNEIGVIAQFGSAFWNNKFTLGDIYTEVLLNYFKIQRFNSVEYVSENSNSSGLKYTISFIPCILISLKNQLLGLVYTTKDLLKESIDSKIGTFYSRERNKKWVKGKEISGNYVYIKKIFFNCDFSSIVMIVKEMKFCHVEGRMSCFNMLNRNNEYKEYSELQGIRNCEINDNSNNIINMLEQLVSNKKKSLITKFSSLFDDNGNIGFNYKKEFKDLSYTDRLLLPYNEFYLKCKLKEEVRELCYCLKSNNDKVTREEVINEATDLIYFLIVYLKTNNVSFEDILNELRIRNYAKTKTPSILKTIDDRENFISLTKNKKLDTIKIGFPDTYIENQETIIANILEYFIKEYKINTYDNSTRVIDIIQKQYYKYFGIINSNEIKESNCNRKDDLTTIEDTNNKDTKESNGNSIFKSRNYNKEILISDNLIIKLVLIKHKDVETLIINNLLDYIITYKDKIQEVQTKLQFVHSLTSKGEKQNGVFKGNQQKIALISKQNFNLKEKSSHINDNVGKKARKLKLITEYDYFAFKWVADNNLNNKIKIISVYGKSESYLANDLCDLAVCVVDTGSTLKNNDLKIEEILFEDNSLCCYKILE